MNRERLLELAGVDQLNEERWDTAAKMLAHVFSELKQIVAIAAADEHDTKEDLLQDLDDLIEQIENSEVRRS